MAQRLLRTDCVMLMMADSMVVAVVVVSEINDSQIGYSIHFVSKQRQNYLSNCRCFCEREKLEEKNCSICWRFRIFRIGVVEDRSQLIVGGRKRSENNKRERKGAKDQFKLVASKCNNVNCVHQPG